MAEALSITGASEEDQKKTTAWSYPRYAGHKLLAVVDNLHGLAALLVITLAVGMTKFHKSTAVIHPLIRQQIARAGFRLLPMVTFLAFALGLVVIGQTVLILNRFGVQNYAGKVMVTVVVRELGPMIAALLVLARVGTATVIELGTARALGEIEALEALGIDPIHYLVVPRVIGLALSIFALTIYFVSFTLVSGYLFAFVEGVQILPGDYFRQLSDALLWQDFVLLVAKTIAFGVLIALVTCYEGLAQRIRLEQVSRATTSAVAKCVIGVVVLDAVFMVIYQLV